MDIKLMKGGDNYFSDDVGRAIRLPWEPWERTPGWQFWRKPWRRYAKVSPMHRTNWVYADHTDFLFDEPVTP